MSLSMVIMTQIQLTQVGKEIVSEEGGEYDGI